MTNPDGNRQLTPRQIQVLRCLAHGQNAPEAATTLGISKTTARVHLEALKSRLKARTIAHAVLLGVMRGYINIPFVLQESDDVHRRPHREQADKIVYDAECMACRTHGDWREGYADRRFR